MRKNRPLVTIKYAQTLDGKIADREGRSRWISGRESRRFTHKLRSRHQAILVGVDTVIKDNPRLTVRLVKGKNPVRIILDSKLRTPLNSKIIQKTKSGRTIIAAGTPVSKKKLKILQEKGIEVLIAPATKNGRVDLPKLLNRLNKLKIKSILVEGGSKVITSFLKEKLADKLVVFITPRIMGKGLEAIGNLEISDINKSLRVKLEEVKKKGEDLAVMAKVK